MNSARYAQAPLIGWPKGVLYITSIHTLVGFARGQKQDIMSRKFEICKCLKLVTQNATLPLFTPLNNLYFPETLLQVNEELYDSISDRDTTAK